jgi:hypothetical protein
MSLQIIDLILDEESTPLVKTQATGSENGLKEFLLSVDIQKFADIDPELEIFENLKVFNSEVLEYFSEVFRVISAKTTDKTENLLLDLESRVLIVLHPESRTLGLFVIDDGKNDPCSSISQVINTLLHWLWLKLNSY